MQDVLVVVEELAAEFDEGDGREREEGGLIARKLGIYPGGDLLGLAADRGDFLAVGAARWQRIGLSFREG